MIRGNLAPGSPFDFRRGAIAVTVLLGVSLSSLSARAEHGGKAPAEDAPRAELDFLFSPPQFSIGVRGGWAFNRSNAEIYDQLIEDLTLSKSDFDGLTLAFDFSWQVTPWVDAVLGLEVSSSIASSEVRFFEDEFGAPIVQDTTLTQLPLTLSVRFYPFKRGRRVGQFAWIPAKFVPYFGGGVGATWYELKQEGEFVEEVVDVDGNVVDRTIFEAVLTSSGWTFAGHAFLGFEIKLTRSTSLVLEGRYYLASAAVGGSFVGFDPIDLDGARAMAGIKLKF